jgi:hypothetical protein
MRKSDPESPLPLSIRLDPVSNGEVLPAPIPRLREAQRLAHAQPDRTSRQLGVKVICVHKGLSLEGFDPAYAGCRDVGRVARAFGS